MMTEIAESTDLQRGFVQQLARLETQLQRLEEGSAQEQARIDASYREIQRRDGAAWWHAKHWRTFGYALLGGLLVSISVNIYLALRASEVQAFVQVVQETEDQRLVQVGVPMDLLAYKPTDGKFMDMLSHWVQKKHWKGDDDDMKRTRNDWAWVYAHTCTPASERLKRDEALENPFKPSKVQVSIEVLSVLKTETPLSYQVNWREVRVEKSAGSYKPAEYITTFTVGRVKPKTLKHATLNRLGLCVTGYGTAPAKGNL